VRSVLGQLRSVIVAGLADPRPNCAHI